MTFSRLALALAIYLCFIFWPPTLTMDRSAGATTAKTRSRTPAQSKSQQQGSSPGRVGSRTASRAEVDEHVVELQLVDPQALEASGPEAWSASASCATRPGSWECLGERL